MSRIVRYGIAFFLGFIVCVAYNKVYMPVTKVAIAYHSERKNNGLVRIFYEPNPWCFTHDRTMGIRIDDWEQFVKEID